MCVCVGGGGGGGGGGFDHAVFMLLKVDGTLNFLTTK